MLENVANTITDEPVELAVDIIPQGKIHAILQRIGVISKKKVFRLRQITIGNLIRISRIVLSVDTIDFGNEDQILSSAVDSIAKSGDKVAELVAVAIHNKRSAPPKSLIDFVKANFTASELKAVVGIILKQMNVQDFIISIVSVKGIQILKTSPDDQGS